METRTNNYCINKAKKQLRKATALIYEASNIINKIDARYLPKRLEHEAEWLLLQTIGLSEIEEVYLDELELGSVAGV